jgi:hypothetical protein
MPLIPAHGRIAVRDEGGDFVRVDMYSGRNHMFVEVERDTLSLSAQKFLEAANRNLSRLRA